MYFINANVNVENFNVHKNTPLQSAMYFITVEDKICFSIKNTLSINSKRGLTYIQIH